MKSSTMVGTGHHLSPDPLQSAWVCFSAKAGGGLCTVGERQERQLEGVGTKAPQAVRSVRRRREEAPELLLASNLGAPAPPGCNGALAPLRRPGRPVTLPSTDDLQASTRRGIEIEIDQQTSSTLSPPTKVTRWWATGTRGHTSWPHFCGFWRAFLSAFPPCDDKQLPLLRRDRHADQGWRLAPSWTKKEPRASASQVHDYPVINTGQTGRSYGQRMKHACIFDPSSPYQSMDRAEARTNSGDS